MSGWGDLGQALLKQIARREVVAERTVQKATPVVDWIACTYCKGIEFYRGPECGIACNICCANGECRHWFCWTESTAELYDLHRIATTGAEREAERAEIEQITRDRLQDDVDAGAAIYHRGGTLVEAWQDQGHIVGELVLAGFLQAMIRDQAGTTE